MNRLLLLPLAAMLACGGCSASGDNAPPSDTEKVPLGLSTTLPIYWSESADMSAMLSEEAEPGWTRTMLERRFELRPLDVLSAESLANFDHLLLAQPRALSPAENVALDDWVRAGGRLLLLADPMLTFHSQFPIGDPRRPQDVALLSPILTRWGLELTFDADQAQSERLDDAFGIALPVRLAGAFEKVEGEAVGDCTLSATRIAANCKVGEGRVMAIADAAVLEGEHEGNAETQVAAIEGLLDASLLDNER